MLFFKSGGKVINIYKTFFYNSTDRVHFRTKIKLYIKRKPHQSMV